MSEPTQESPARLALRIALGYLLVATLWIIVSDRVVAVYGFDDSLMAQTFKGLAFVTVTAAALYLVVLRYASAVMRATREALDARGRLEAIYHLLGDVSSFVLRAGHESEMYERVCSAIVETDVFEGAWIAEYRPEDGVMVLVALEGFTGDESSPGVAVGSTCSIEECAVRSVLETGEPYIDNDVDAGFLGRCLKPVAGATVRSFAALPIAHDGAVVATLCVSSRSPDTFGEIEERLLARLASDLSVGVSRVMDARRNRVLAECLEQSEQRYRDLFEANPGPLFVYDLETLRFLDVNPAAIEHYGYSREEFLSMTIAEIRPAEDVPKLLENVSQIHKGFDFAGVWRHLTKDGRTILVEITSHTFDYDGRAAELVRADDVTALFEATAELRHTATRLSAIVSAAPVAIISVDCNGLVTGWNPAAEGVFGWSEDEVLGRPLPIIPARDRDFFEDTLKRSVAQGDRLRMESRRLARDGRLLDVVVYTAPLAQEDGEFREVLAIILDVTERKRAEEELRLYKERLEELVDARTSELATVNERLRQANRVKSEFLANMSHELRTPLNSIIGFSGILLQGLSGELGEEQAKQVSMVHRSGKHLLELINDILDLSRIESERVAVELTSFDLGSVAGSVVDDLLPLASEKGIELGFDHDLYLMVRSDRTKVRQILYNLMGNAIKFTGEGSVELSVESLDDRIDIRITDTGPGIAPADFEAIFDEFHQARRRADEKPAGTGLGLSISRKLARLMGGEITVTSSVGVGSTFTLTLPRGSGADRLSERS